MALAVLAVALGALVKGGAGNAANAGYLRDKTLASWVAANKAVEYQLQAEWAPPGSRNGSEEMAGREWFWTAKVSDTFDADVRRLEVEVRAGERDAGLLAKLTAFLARPGAGP